jgi:aryl-alcohol dehydrogenase-like predicted oxidoreductase
MEYMPLGRSGLKISPVCLGTMNFGTSAGIASCDEREAGRIIGSFLDAGCNIIDTADGYASGQSEEIVGRAIRARREAVVLATKAFLPQGPGPNDQGLARIHLTRALEASLRRLGTDHVDLYQCHQWDDTTPIEETMAALDGFVRAGKVRYLGCSNFTAAQVVESHWAAQRLGGTPFISLQSQYSLLERSIEGEILRACQRHGLGVLAWSPLGGGVLADRYQRGVTPGRDTRAGRLEASAMPAARAWGSSMLTERNLTIAGAVAKIAAESGATPASVALAWVAQQPGITSVIIGPRTAGQLQDSLAGFAVRLPSSLVTRLGEVSQPGSAWPLTGLGTHKGPVLPGRRPGTHAGGTNEPLRGRECAG